MATEFDVVSDLTRRVAELESLISKEVLKVRGGADSFAKIFSRFDRLQSALEQQQQAFEEFMGAHTIKKSNDLSQPLSLRPDISVAAINHSAKSNKDAATQTPPARAPSVPPPVPPPVRVRPSENPPKGPSPLRRSSSADCGQQQPLAPVKDATATSQPSSVQRNPSGLATPPSHLATNQQSPSSAKSKGGKGAQGPSLPSAATDDVGLRERRAAFAALQSFAPQNKASKRTSLAIAAAQREMVRAAARSREEATRERDENSGVLAWIGFILIVIGGIGATLLGVMAMTMKAERMTTPATT